MPTPTVLMESEVLYDALADSLLSRADVTRRTLMGFPWLRANGQFFACQHRQRKHLVVKLSRERVAELIAAGQAAAFAPAGRPLRDWAEIRPQTRTSGPPSCSKR